MRQGYLSLFGYICLAVICFSMGWTEEEPWERIARQVWYNECKHTLEGLVSWNEGEEFPSLGIGHFIWYPADYQGPFQETFDELLTFFQTKNMTLPKSLEERICPWSSREEFLRNWASCEMQELCLFLLETAALQAEFMVRRLDRSLPLILAHIEQDKRAQIMWQFNRVLQEPLGSYVLLDYLNFKGEGILSEERYGGRGWGLLQVLEEMSAFDDGSAIVQFVHAAKSVLLERVQNAPIERKEARWLPGWHIRLNTYTQKDSKIGR